MDQVIYQYKNGAYKYTFLLCTEMTHETFCRGFSIIVNSWKLE